MATEGTNSHEVFSYLIIYIRLRETWMIAIFILFFIYQFVFIFKSRRVL